MGPMEPGRDGDQFGKAPRGVRLSLDIYESLAIFFAWVGGCGRVNSAEITHIGLYTAKPFAQRIESHQGHSRDNASAMRINSQRLTWVGDELVYGRRTLLRIVRDRVYPEMWRVRLPGGGLTDMVNRTRAKDAALSIAHRLLNMSETLSEAPPTAPNDFEALSDLETTCSRPGVRQGTGRKG